MKIIFTGTSEFAQKYLKFLIDSDIRIEAVITQPDSPKGRKRKLTPSPVAITADAYNLPLYKPNNISDTTFVDETLNQLNPDLMIVVAYGQILKENILNSPKYGCINIHPSDLPLYRGAAPIQRTLLNGETKTAACIIQMDKGLDSGNIIKKTNLDILPTDNFGALEAKLFAEGATLLLEAINDIQNNTVNTYKQDHDKATYAHKIKKCDTLIDLNKSALEIHNQVRALCPYPLASVEAMIKNQKMQIKIWETKIIEDNSNKTPGVILTKDKNTLIIKTQKDAISIRSLQLPGKKQVNIADFLRGYDIAHDAFKN